MIPIRDTVPSKNYPFVNYAIIAVNVAVYLIQLIQGPHLEAFIYTYGLVPARYSNPSFGSHFTAGQQIFAMMSFMFLHGGFWHILGNLWSLYIFGDNVEDRLGSFPYLILNFHSTTPTIGASGAIAGVMGAYFILYPRARILTLVPIIIIPWMIEIPAFFFLGFWFIMQVFNASLSTGLFIGIAWWAHIAGFIFGIAFIRFIKTMPDSRFIDPLKHLSVKKHKSDRLQILHPESQPDGFDMYDVIHITPYEAAGGANKFVNIPWGFYNRTYKVSIPPGARDGMILRLKGLGKPMPDLRNGDLLLKVIVEQPW
ncbi:MAG: rhomboid family intramembrane serine protease [Desulfobacterales bacterium]|nr:rhomboid family intramembrane serine protease [Desulfobacterales bacterium]